jgi:hypothetical protein
MAKYLRAGWKSEQEIGGRGGCPVKGQWHRKLKGWQILRDPGWTCVQYVRTGRTGEDIFMRVMFDTIRERSIILHSVAVKLGLRASGGPIWLGHRGEDSRYSSCEYKVPVLDWKGCSQWIKARGVSYTTPSKQRDMPKGAREAFPEITWSSVKVSQGAGPVDMIIGRDNPEWASPGAGGAVRAVHLDVDEPVPALHPPGERGDTLEAVAAERGRRERCGPHGARSGECAALPNPEFFHRTPV